MDSCTFLRYDEDSEIVAGAVPKYGRVVVWQSSVSYLPRPPSIAFKKGQLLLHVQFTKSKQKVLASHIERDAFRNERKAVYDAGFIGSDKPAPTGIDVAQHFVSEHMSMQGKRILVFDDLFDKEDLDKLRAFIFKHGTYYYDDSDEGDDDSDNVQWIAGFEISDYIQSRLWNIMQQVCCVTFEINDYIQSRLWNVMQQVCCVTLNPSLQDSTLSLVNVMSLWMKSKSVTIQMKSFGE